MFKSWQEAAEYCEITFGAYVDWEDRFFHCIECDEPLYLEDWKEHEWHICPICECNFEEIG